MLRRLKEPEYNKPMKYSELIKALKDVTCLCREIVTENHKFSQAVHSATYILEELNNAKGMEKMAELTGRPIGVIVSAFESIFDGYTDHDQ